MGRTTHYVSSTAYNLAGDQKGRADILQIASIGRVLSGSDQGFGSIITQSLLNGPGMGQRRFFQWAKDNYDYGVPSSSRTIIPEVPLDKVEAGMVPGLALGSNVEVRALTAVVDKADSGYWVDAWVRDNRPTKVNTAYLIYDMGSNQFKVEFTTLDYAIVTMPADYVWGIDSGARRLLYVLYHTITTNVDGTSTVSPPMLYTYRMGTGNVVFDALQATVVAGADYFPVIPLREYNNSVKTYGASRYANLERAYKKLTGGKLDDFLETLEANDSINDLDYAFIVPGVSLSTKDNSALAYLYQYFQLLSLSAGGSPTSFSNYIAEMNGVDAASVAERRWLTATDATNADGQYHPLFGTFKPASAQIRYDLIAYTERYSAPLLPTFDYYLTWNSIVETDHIGNAKNTITSPFDNGKLRKGDYWSSVGDDPTTYSAIAENAASPFSFVAANIGSRIFLYKQISKYRYKRLEIIGLNHRNNVYAGNSVNISGKQALQDGTANEPSGFIVPLHYPTLKALGLLEGTRLAKESNYLVLNTHVTVKKKWYQTGIFRVILFIAVIAISIFTGGSFAAFGAKIGLLGSNIAVGSAIGLSGTAAIVAGAVANGIAAMIVSSFIQKASIKLFGDKFGSIIGAVLTFTAMQYGMQYANYGNFDVDWGSMMRADNLIKVTNAVGKSYTQWLNADLASIKAEMAEAKETYGKDMEKVEKAMDDLTGDMSNLIDAMMLTDSALIYPESSETYLNRTLLTGSDIAELSFSMIENFPEISRELPTAFA